MILFEKKYQTFDTVFHHQMKHCVSCLIYYINAVLKGELETGSNNYRILNLSYTSKSTLNRKVVKVRKPV